MPVEDAYRTLAPEALAPSQLLRSLGLQASKRLGQNFLTSRSAVHHILSALDMQPGESAVEIGSGLGVLTGYLAELADAVVAIELDDDLVAHLRELLSGVPSVTVLHADILALDPERVFGDRIPPYRVVGNLPYYITSAALRHVLSWVPAPRRVVAMVQYEVAKRIVATAGDMSLLSLMVQMKGSPRLVARVPAGAFVPAPKVGSAVVSITPHASPLAPPAQEEQVFRLARMGFQQGRKMILNSLAAGMAAPKAQVHELLARAGIPASARAEDLSVDQWLSLARLTAGSS